MIPISGSAYTYAYATLGEIFAWMIGWDLILEYAVGSMTVAVGWSGYFQRILAGDVHLPVWMSAAPAAGVEGAIVNLPAILIVLAITALLVIGVRERTVQRGDRGDQACGHSLFHHRWRRLREARELVRSCRTGSLASPQPRPLSCLHRIRRGLDHGRRSQEPEP